MEILRHIRYQQVFFLRQGIKEKTVHIPLYITVTETA